MGQREVHDVAQEKLELRKTFPFDVWPIVVHGNDDDEKELFEYIEPEGKFDEAAR